eukprot:CAMPEP_0177577896 /NCGR_PEP_ID=MMETSP0419_2-20121207/30_1 /TAXON_ID=582737 /ORGANISM="Tetraselmis sp., Strain GSL018" /LENGTH=235 /DNA_ID=CAMNT_0019066245 /DNA_START=453 /DNA_END=1160 /DNA_ORIENTATION=-
MQVCDMLSSFLKIKEYRDAETQTLNEVTDTISQTRSDRSSDIQMKLFEAIDARRAKIKNLRKIEEKLKKHDDTDRERLNLGGNDRPRAPRAPAQAPAGRCPVVPTLYGMVDAESKKYCAICEYLIEDEDEKYDLSDCEHVAHMSCLYKFLGVGIGKCNFCRKDIKETIPGHPKSKAILARYAVVTKKKVAYEYSNMVDKIVDDDPLEAPTQKLRTYIDDNVELLGELADLKLTMD